MTEPSPILDDIAIRRMTYQERREHGLCVERCCMQRAALGRVRCRTHLEMVNRACAKIRSRRTEVDVAKREQRLVERAREEAAAQPAADVVEIEHARHARKRVPRGERLGNSLVTRDASGRVIVTKIA